MLVRSHPWSQKFLARVYGEEGNVFIKHSWWEQAAMHHLLNDDVSTAHDMEVPAVPPLSPLEASTWQLTRQHVQYVPQWWINRYAAQDAQCFCNLVRRCGITVASGVRVASVTRSSWHPCSGQA